MAEKKLLRVEARLKHGRVEVVEVFDRGTHALAKDLTQREAQAVAKRLLQEEGTHVFWRY